MHAADSICYLAICRYETERYYLFSCDDQMDVVGDSLWSSVEECMEVARSSYGELSWSENELGAAN